MRERERKQLHLSKIYLTVLEGLIFIVSTHFVRFLNVFVSNHFAAVVNVYMFICMPLSCALGVNVKFIASKKYPIIAPNPNVKLIAPKYFL